MDYLSDIKNKIESLINKVVKSISINDSPMTKWLDLNDEQKSELTFFHFTYGWLFLLNNKFIVQGDKFTLGFYFDCCYKEFNKYSKDISKELFIELFFNRYKAHSNELPLVIKNNLNPSFYFPIYFYTKLMYESLELDTKIENKKYSYSEFEIDEEGLSDIYIHQVNFISNSLKLNLK